MDRQNRLLLSTLDRDKAHGRPSNRFTDRFGIVRVVLARFTTFPIRRDELGCDQFHLMADLRQLARPVMRTPTGFQADSTGRQVRKEREHLSTFQGLAEDHFFVFIHPVNLEDLFRNIQSNTRHVHDESPDRLWPFIVSSLAPPLPFEKGESPYH